MIHRHAVHRMSPRRRQSQLDIARPARPASQTDLANQPDMRTSKPNRCAICRTSSTRRHCQILIDQHLCCLPQSMCCLQDITSTQTMPDMRAQLRRHCQMLLDQHLCCLQSLCCLQDIASTQAMPDMRAQPHRHCQMLLDQHLCCLQLLCCLQDIASTQTMPDMRAQLLDRVTDVSGVATILEDLKALRTDPAPPSDRAASVRHSTADAAAQPAAATVEEQHARKVALWEELRDRSVWKLCVATWLLPALTLLVHVQVCFCLLGPSGYHGTDTALHAVDIGKAPSVVNNLIISRAAHGQISGHR